MPSSAIFATVFTREYVDVIISWVGMRILEEGVATQGRGHAGWWVLNPGGS
jgi:hypothetical protein